MLIYLLRHGLTAYNAEKRYQGQRDIPLSPEGRAQLRQADLIFRLVWAKKPRRALVTAPTFAEYAAALETVGCTVERFILQAADDFAVPEAFLSAIDDRMDLVFLCQPNNPTGQLTPPDFVARILQRCTACGALLVLDECFLDFLPDHAQLTAMPLLGSGDLLIL